PPVLVALGPGSERGGRRFRDAHCGRRYTCILHQLPSGTPLLYEPADEAGLDRRPLTEIPRDLVQARVGGWTQPLGRVGHVLLPCPPVPSWLRPACLPLATLPARS